jgi:hypothetical protein
VEGAAAVEMADVVVLRIDQEVDSTDSGYILVLVVQAKDSLLMALLVESHLDPS